VHGTCRAPAGTRVWPRAANRIRPKSEPPRSCDRGGFQYSHADPDRTTRSRSPENFPVLSVELTRSIAPKRLFRRYLRTLQKRERPNREARAFTLNLQTRRSRARLLEHSRVQWGGWPHVVRTAIATEALAAAKRLMVPAAPRLSHNGLAKGQAPFGFSTGRATRPASVVVESRGVRPCSTSTASTITASPSTRELTWISTLVEPVLKEIDAGWPTFAKIRGASRTFPTASVTRTQLMTISLTLSSSSIPSSTRVASTAIAAIWELDAVSSLDVLEGCREWHAVAMQRPREAIARMKVCGRCMHVKTSHRPVGCTNLHVLVHHP